MALQSVVGGERVFALSNVPVIYNAYAGWYHSCVKVYNKTNAIIEIYIQF